jgi:hypothetical protein
MARTRNKGSGPWRVTRHAMPPRLIFPSLRDAIILWFSWGGCETVVGTSGCHVPVLWVVMNHGLLG